MCVPHLYAPTSAITPTLSVRLENEHSHFSDHGDVTDLDDENDKMTTGSGDAD